MSTEAIQRVVHELAGLPEADQQIVLRFLAALRSNRNAAAQRPAPNEGSPAIREKNGLLVFTGRVDALETDWLQVVRHERDDELAQLAVGGSAGR